MPKVLIVNSQKGFWVYEDGNDYEIMQVDMISLSVPTRDPLLSGLSLALSQVSVCEGNDELFRHTLLMK